MQSGCYAEVVLPLPVDHGFTYLVPDHLVSRAAVGMRAVVPVQNRIETGYIVGLMSQTEVAKLKPLLDLPDSGPVFLPSMIELCRWMAEYYCCSLGEALQCAVPAGLKIRSVLRYTLMTDQLVEGRYSASQKLVVAALYKHGSLTEAQLAEVLGVDNIGSALQTLMARGLVVGQSVLRKASVSIRTEPFVRLVEANVPDVNVLAALQRRAPKQAAVYLDLLHGNPERAMHALCDKHETTLSLINALVKRGFIERFERDVFRTPDLQEDERSRDKFELNAPQQVAYDAIIKAQGLGDFQTFLLHGITGSGKTEVYLQAIEHALSLGRDAILLVPEISLTPQTVGRLVGRFGGRIAVLHSALGAGERYDEWRRAQRGEVHIVVGARSAVFAPLPDVGLIIVDEEHDTSYKQAETPRYHARDVAIMRAKMNKAVCVLGSATPSIESYHNSETGKFARLEILCRATQSPLPVVRLVDMRMEARETGGEIILSRELQSAVEDRIKQGEQVILLLNRRGHSPFVLCPKCGWVAECVDCNVSLTYHAAGGYLNCHYCNARAEVPGRCATCGFDPLLFIGVGTQKAEDLLMRVFAGARIARMDADTTSGKGGHARILGRFASGDIDILIGTQMIAKGHDYPGVTLVGVIGADTTLALPDFRAAENAFQLLTQVAGRAGRGSRVGEVIIQTHRPNHYAIQAAMTHDYGTFYTREIAERKAAGYPPVRRLLNLSVESEDPLLVEKAAGRLRRLVLETIAQLGYGALDVLGPSPAVVHRVKKRYRWNLGVLSKSAMRLNGVARGTRDGFAKIPDTSDVQLKVDLDPYGVY